MTPTTMRVLASPTDERPSPRSVATVDRDLPPEIEEALAVALAGALVASIRRDASAMSNIPQDHPVS